MTDPKPELKPCPFCGTPPEFDPGDANDPWSRIACCGNKCLDEISYIGAESEVIKRWNTRVTGGPSDE